MKISNTGLAWHSVLVEWPKIFSFLCFFFALRILVPLKSASVIWRKKWKKNSLIYHKQMLWKNILNRKCTARRPDYWKKESNRSFSPICAYKCVDLCWCCRPIGLCKVLLKMMRLHHTDILFKIYYDFHSKIVKYTYICLPLLKKCHPLLEISSLLSISSSTKFPVLPNLIDYKRWKGRDGGTQFLLPARIEPDSVTLH